MASIRASKRTRKTSTGQRKQTLSDKKMNYGKRSSISPRNTQSTIKKKSATTGKVNNGSKQKFDVKKCLLSRSNKIIAYFNENSVSVEKSKSSRKSPISCQRQTRNSLSKITRKSCSENNGKKHFDHSKTPVPSKSVRKPIRYSALKNITNDDKNKEISQTSTGKLAEHNAILNTTQGASVRCTRSSVGESSSASSKKSYGDKSTVSASKVPVSTKPTKKSLDFTPKISSEKTLSSGVKNCVIQMTPLSVHSKKKSVENPLKQISAECREQNHKQDKIKDGSSTRPSNQTSANVNYISTKQRFSARLAQKVSNDQEHTPNENVQLSSVTTEKKKTSSIKNKTKTSSIKNKTKTSSINSKTEIFFSKNSLSVSYNASPIPLCTTQRSTLVGGRTSMSPLRKIGSSSATTACKRNFTNKKAQKFRQKIESFDLSNIPLDVLMPKASGTKRKLKSADFKLPGKKTLKYKRMTVEAVKQADNGYEDDILESKNFDIFQKLLFSPAVSESALLMSTPKLGIDLTPVVRKKTPVFKDCYNPEELAKRRKIAEEYFYRVNKNKNSSSKLDTPIPVIPEKKKLEFNEVMKKASKIQEEFDKQFKECEGDEEDKEDSYFSFLESPAK